MGGARKIEHVLAEWHGRMPHLPKSVRIWLVKHMWMIASVIFIVLISELFVLIPLVFEALALTPTANIVGPDIPYSQTVSEVAWMSLAVFVVSFLVTAMLVAGAIYPLRVRVMKGFSLMLYAYLVFVVLSSVASMLMFNVSALVSLLLGAIIFGYMIFESRFELAHAVSSSRKKS